jgi:hypothetical protein
MFGVHLRKCERWICLYEASCNVFSELGPVGGPITVESVMMDSKRAMRECNSAWGYNHHHQLGFAGVLEPSQDDSEEV